jgi:hypothetical protein
MCENRLSGILIGCTCVWTVVVLLAHCWQSLQNSLMYTPIRRHTKRLVMSLLVALMPGWALGNAVDGTDNCTSEAYWRWCGEDVRDHIRLAGEVPDV